MGLGRDFRAWRGRDAAQGPDGWAGGVRWARALRSASTRAKSSALVGGEVSGAWSFGSALAESRSLAGTLVGASGCGALVGSSDGDCAEPRSLARAGCCAGGGGESAWEFGAGKGIEGVGEGAKPAALPWPLPLRARTRCAGGGGLAVGSSDSDRAEPRSLARAAAPSCQPAWVALSSAPPPRGS